MTPKPFFFHAEIWVSEVKVSEIGVCFLTTSIQNPEVKLSDFGYSWRSPAGVFCSTPLKRPSKKWKFGTFWDLLVKIITKKVDILPQHSQKLTWPWMNNHEWRCISYWTCVIFQLSILVFSKVTRTILSTVSSPSLWSHFLSKPRLHVSRTCRKDAPEVTGSNKKSHPEVRL